MIDHRDYDDTLIEIYSTDNKFILQTQTGYKCVLTLDTKENLDLYTETEEDAGTLRQEVYEKALIHSYSAAKKYLLQNETGIPYEDAIDVPNKYTYTETEEDLPSDGSKDMMQENPEELANG